MLNFPKGEIDIILTGPRLSRQMHIALFGTDSVPNVISQRIASDAEAAALVGECVLGEICINIRRAADEADAADIDPLERVFELAVHGLLHLAGYDHIKDNGEMYELQDKLMDQFASQLGGSSA